MGAFKKFVQTTWGIVRPVGVAVGVAAMLVGFVVDVSGASTFWSLSPDEWTRLGLTLIAVFGAIIVLRHEYLIREIDNIWGNENLKSLYQEGIFPTRDVYMQYVRSGNFGIVNRFWKGGIVNITDPSDRSDLHAAAESGHAAIARGIIEHGGDLKRTDRQGRTPLMMAASRGHSEVVKVLLEHDCAFDASATQDGVSALYAAAANGHEVVVDLLIKAKAKIDAPDQDNITPLMAAIAQNNWAVAEKLVDAGADLTRVDATGATIANYIGNNPYVPEKFSERVQNAGITTNARLERRGSGHSGTGKVTIHWAKKGE